MFKFCLSILLLLGLIHCDLFAQKQALMLERTIRVKLTEQAHNKVQRQMSRQSFTTQNVGLNSVGKLNSSFQAIEMRQIFRSDKSKFKKRHNEFGLSRWYEITLNSRVSDQILELYSKDKNIEIAEPIHKKQLVDGSGRENSYALVDDPRYEDQWHYENTGQTGGTAGADIKLADAWIEESGTPDVVVAIIDGGVDYTHEDLQDAMWKNLAELNGEPNVDDDNNGYIDDIYGYNFYLGNGNVTADDHGTHVGGTIAATNNNGIGVSGVAGGDGTGNGARIMSCQVFDGFSGDGFAEAIVYGADNGAVICQNSWGYTMEGDYEQIVLDAIDYFIEYAGKDEDGKQVGPMNGGIVIFAAGNSSSDGECYPGYYPPVFAVAATDHNDKVTSYSNYGDWIDISAPGGDMDYGDEMGVLSTFPNNQYGYYNGTSMACPHVSGAAALIVSKYKDKGLTPQMVWNRLQLSDPIDDINPGYEGKLGTGRLNAANALKTPDTIPPSTTTDLMAYSTDAISIEIGWTAPGESADSGKAATYDIKYSTSPINDEESFKNAKTALNIPKPMPAGSLEIFTIKGLDPETTYYIALKAYDVFLNESEISNVIIATTKPAPEILLTPNPLLLVADENSYISTTFTIKNIGKETLFFDIPFKSPSNDSLFLPEDSLFFSGNIEKMAKGGDYSGYYWVDSKESTGPTFDWQEISGTGTDLFLVPENVAYIDLDFAFPFYDETYTGLYISPTGVLAFDPHYASSLYNEPIPNESGPNGYIAPFWSYLIPAYGGSIYYQNFEDKLIIEYDHVLCLIDDDYYTFQVIIYDNGNILFQYKEMGIAGSETATIGIENMFGTEGMQVAYNTQYVEDNLAILISNASMITSVNPLLGEVEPGGTATIEVAVSSEGLDPSNYTSFINIFSNDPKNEVVTESIQLHVNGTPEISADSLLSFGEVFVLDTLARNLTITNTGTDSLFITDIELNNPNFTLADFHAKALYIGESVTYSVLFHPEEETVSTGELIISNNAQGSTIVEMEGSGLYPPEMQVTPDTIRIQLAAGKSTDKQIVISNATGRSALNWNVEYKDIHASKTKIGFYATKSGAKSISTRNPFENFIKKEDIAVTSNLEVIEELGNFNIETTGCYKLGNFLFYVEFANKQVCKFDLSKRIVVDSFAVNFSPFGLTYAEGLLWVGSYYEGIVYGYDLEGNMMASFDLPSNYDYTLTFNGKYFLAAPIGSGDVPVLEIDFNGDIINEYEQPISHIYGCTWSQNTLWVSSSYLPTYIYSQSLVNNRAETKDTIVFDVNLAEGPILSMAHDGKNLYIISGGGYGAIIDDNVNNEWLSFDFEEGRVEAGDSLIVPLHFSTLGLVENTYSMNVAVNSNDPTNRSEMVYVEMFVDGTPVIDVTDTIMLTSFVSYSHDTTISISNIGSDDLIIDSIQISDKSFTLSIADSIIKPGMYAEAVVSFSPTSPGVTESGITIFYNDSSKVVENIVLMGNGVLPPVLNTYPDSIYEQLVSGDSLVSQITIDNTEGNSPLVWDLDIKNLKKPKAERAKIGMYSTKAKKSISNIDVLSMRKNLPVQPMSDLSIEDTLTNFPYTTLGMYEANGIIYAFSLENESVCAYNLKTKETTILFKLNDIYFGLAYAEGLIWLSDYSGVIYGYTLSGELVASFDTPINSLCAITYNGEYIIATEIFSPRSNVYALDFDGTIVNEYATDTIAVSGISYGEGKLWILNDSWPATACRADFEDSAVIVEDIIPLPEGISSYSIAHDGEKLYISAFDDTAFVIDDNYVSNKWLTAYEKSGVVNAGESQIIDLSFNATDLYEGDYYSNMIINSNDPANSADTISVQMNVIGIPAISVEPEELFFESYVEYSDSSKFEILSLGTGSLIIDSIVSTNNAFVVSETNVTIPFNNSKFLTVYFMPQTDGETTGELQIFSNDPVKGMQTISLVGFAQYPPVLSVSPDRISEEMMSGETLLKQLSIDNSNGLSPLEWSLSIEPKVSPRKPKIGLYAPMTNTSKTASSKVDLKSLRQNVPVTPLSDLEIIEVRDGMPLHCVGMDFSENKSLLYAYEDSSESIIEYDLQTQSYKTLFYVGWCTGITYAEGLFWTIRIEGDVYGYDFEGNILASFESPIRNNYASIAYAGEHFIVAEKFTTINVFYVMDFDGTIVKRYYSDSINLSNFTYGKGKLWMLNNSYPESIIKADFQDDRIVVEDVITTPEHFQGDGIAHDGQNLFISSYDGVLYELNDNNSNSTWLKVNKTEGVLEPGESEQLDVLLDATGLFEGEYYSNIVISSNDPAKKVDTVEAHINVRGIPQISIAADSLFFDCYVGYSDSATLEISNVGTAYLSIDSIVCDNGMFAYADSSFEISYESTKTVQIAFTPTADGSIFGNAYIYSNDSLNRVTMVSLAGIAKYPPAISVRPDSLYEELPTNFRNVQYITIDNSKGEGELSWNMEAVQISGKSKTKIGMYVQPNASNKEKVSWKEKYEPRLKSQTASDSANIIDILKGFPSFSYGACYVNSVIYAMDDMSNIYEYDMVSQTSKYLFYPSEIGNASGLTYAEGLLWMSNMDGAIYGYDLDGNLIASFKSPFPYETTITFNGKYFLLSEVFSGGIIYVVDFDGSIIDVMHSDFNGIITMTWGADKLWVLSASNNINRVDISNSEITIEDEIYVEYIGGWSFALMHDGNNLLAGDANGYCYVIDDNFSGNSNNNNWLSLTEESGTVDAGDIVEIPVTFDATDMNEGDYYSTILISSNDPENPELMVPAHLYVDGYPLISVTEESVEFECYVNQSTTEYFTIKNVGYDVLNVSGFEAENPYFSFNETEFSLEPNESKTIEATFSPLSDGYFEEEIRIFSNDTSVEFVTVLLQAEAQLPPIIKVTPEVFRITIAEDDVRFGSILIENEGNSVLTYSVYDWYSDSSFFTLGSTGGFVQAHDSEELDIMFDADDIKADVYYSELYISSNDPESEDIFVPVIVTVIDECFDDEVSVEETICYGDSIVIGKSVFKEEGQYSVILENSTGCDSVVNLTLHVREIINHEYTAEVCGGVFWNGEYYLESGVYTAFFENSTGCDSIVTLYLTVNEPMHKEIHAESCDSYTWNDSVYTESGVYVQNFETMYGCDSIVTLYLTISDSYNYNTSVTACGSYIWEGDEYTESGRYTKIFEKDDACDSSVTMYLTILEPTYTEIEVSACNEYVWNEKVLTESGVYSQTLSSEFGCDSIVTLHLTINNTVYFTDTIDACNRFKWNDTVLTESGEYTANLETAAGCDSIVTLQLTIHNSITVDTSVVACDSLLWDGAIIAESGDYSFSYVSSTGCDSTIIIHATINHSVWGEIFVEACEVFEWEGNSYAKSGNYVQVLSTSEGCDSTVTLHLTIHEDKFVETIVEACGSYAWNDTVLTESGEYTANLQTATGCDSTVVLHLTVNETAYAEFSAEACTSYEWFGNTYYDSGDYVQTISNVAGCDSIITLHLTINSISISDTLYASACNSYEWNGKILLESGVYFETFTSAVGCDSIVILNLTINESDYFETEISACESFIWGDRELTESGVYVDSAKTEAGCDSITILHLTIYESTYTEVSESVCGEYVWNGMVYTESGVYTAAFVSSTGCDSIVTLNLTILNTFIDSTSVEACEEFMWNGELLTESGIYTFTYTNLAGCDSIMVVDLTINKGSYSDTTIVACDSLEWDGEVYFESISFTKTYVNSAGCDSIVTLHIVINKTVYSEIAVTACGSYEWYDEVLTESGIYYARVPNYNGCDSALTLALTILESENVDTSVTACGSYVWEGEELFESGTYEHVYTSSMGCDSVVALELIIQEVNTTLTVSEKVIIANAENAEYQWLDCANDMAPIDSAFERSFKPEIDGTYAVEVTENGCSGVSYCISISLVDIADNKTTESIRILPNPTFTGEFTVEAEQMTKLWITTIEGKIITEQVLPSLSKVNMNLESLSKGVYFINVLTENGLGVETLIVE